MGITYTLMIHMEKEDGTEIVGQYEQDDYPESAVILTQVPKHVFKSVLSDVSSGEEFLNALNNLLKECHFTEAFVIESGINGETADERINIFRNMEFSCIGMIHLFEGICYYDQESISSEMHFNSKSGEFVDNNETESIEAVYITCQICGSDYPIIAPDEEWSDYNDGLPAEYGFPSLNEEERAVLQHFLCPKCLKEVGLI